jgi:hypothetical protein
VSARSTVFAVAPQYSPVPRPHSVSTIWSTVHAWVSNIAISST